MPLILHSSKIDEWITPNAKPEKLLPYALTNMIAERQLPANVSADISGRL